MAHIRHYRGGPDEPVRAVLIHRYRGTWSFKTIGGWMWHHHWGFRTELAACMACGRFFAPRRLCGRVTTRGQPLKKLRTKGGAQ